MKRKSIFTYIGLLCVTAALLLTSYNLISDFYYGKKANAKVNEILKEIDINVEENNEEVNNIEDYKFNNLKSYKIDNNYYVGIIEIPSIEITLPVINDSSERSLLIAPGVYVGTPYEPNFVICGHNRITFFSKIKNLTIDDEVYFMDLDGNIFEYKVALKDIIPQENIDEMINSGYDLTLFTCNYDETQRVTLRLNKINEIYK